MVTLGRKPFPFKGLTKKQAEERLKETAENVRLDKSRQAKRIAPAEVNSIDDIVKQARWYGNPQRMDLEGIDTLRPPSTRGRKTKRPEGLVSIAAPEPVIQVDAQLAKARAPSAVSLSLKQRARKMGEDAFARSGGKPVAPAQDKPFMKFLGQKKDDLETLTPLLKAFTEGFNALSDKVADDRVAELAKEIPEFKDLPSQKDLGEKEPFVSAAQQKQPSTDLKAEARKLGETALAEGESLNPASNSAFGRFKQRVAEGKDSEFRIELMDAFQEGVEVARRKTAPPGIDPEKFKDIKFEPAVDVKPLEQKLKTVADLGEEKAKPRGSFWVQLVGVIPGERIEAANMQEAKAIFARKHNVDDIAAIRAEQKSSGIVTPQLGPAVLKPLKEPETVTPVEPLAAPVKPDALELAPDHETALEAAKAIANTSIPPQDNVEGRPEALATTDPAPLAKGRDYILTADSVFDNSPAKRFEANLEAIRLVKRLETDEALATPEEQAKIAQYSGFGDSAFEGAFRRRNFRDSGDIWTDRGDQLKELVTDDEYRAIERSRLNAFYTTPEVVNFMWQAVDRMGIDDLQNPRILEPSAGSGRFLGLQPVAISAKSRRTAVELDDLTGSMLKQLYPNADIYAGTGYQDVPLPDNSIDVAISNVPFGNIPVTDKEFGKGRRFLTKSIHNYFFAKTLDKLKPGGVLAFVTSHNTLDAPTAQPVREALAEKADLVGAIRLPKGAFPDTEVVTDIIFMRKRLPGDTPGDDSWTKVGKVDLPDKDFRGETFLNPTNVNQYFIDNPQNVLGTHALTGTQYRGSEYSVEPLDEPLADSMSKAVQRLPENIINPVIIDKPGVILRARSPETGANAKEGSFVIGDDNQLLVKNDRVLKPAALGLNAAAVVGMLGVRDAGREVLDKQLHDAPEAEITAAQQKLNQVYDEFVKKHGALNSKANTLLMRLDPEGAFLRALEQTKDKGKTWGKMPIFTERVVGGLGEPTVATPRDALSVSLNETGGLDFDRMAQLLGKTREEIIKALAEEGAIFQNPVGGWEAADKYLTGMVREKLVQAAIAAKANPAFNANVIALKKIQPEDLTPSQINVSLGAPWVPAEDVNDFTTHITGAFRFGQRKFFDYSPEGATWVAENRVDGNRAKMFSVWGTDRMGADKIIFRMLNNKPIEVKDPGVDREKPVRNEKETVAAQEKAVLIQEEYQRWLWEDDSERATRLARFYNQNFNNIRPRVYDGDHQTFPGMDKAWVKRLHEHQKSAIWRVVQDGTSLLAHEVGFGKTAVMVGAGMELRRLGLSRKNLYVVPKATHAQFRQQFQEIYPYAKILFPEAKDFDATNRPELMSRIATGDWDSVIIAETQFRRIPVKPSTEIAFINDELNDLRDSLAREDEASGSGKKTRTHKEIEKALLRMEERLKDANARSAEVTDDAIFFEDLGIDQMFVDEADMFKNLRFATGMGRVKGIPNGNAQRASDMFMKVRFLQKQGNGRGVVFATGTPISNTIAEAYTMMRYLQQPALEERGIHNFDAWAATFGSMTEALEQTTTGAFRNTQRFAKFNNLPELSNIWQQVADIRIAAEVPQITERLPRIVNDSGETGARQTIQGKRTPALAAFMETLAVRAANLGNVDPTEDNMLKISSDARKAALDMRLVDPQAPFQREGKLALATDKIAQIYKETTPQLGTQLVFLDLGTPKANDKIQEEGQINEGQSTDETDADIAVLKDVYSDLRNRLVASGVPNDEIAFIHDAKTGKAKEQLFDKLNRGEIRVVLGSTGKMGVGVNVQERAAALHHLDVPWKPRDIEQREGRIVRQGNKAYGPVVDPLTNKVTGEGKGVRIYNYVTQGSFDAFMWQAVEVKAKAIKSIMRRNVVSRSIQDIDELTISASEAKALASGNPDVMKAVTVKNDIARLQLVQASHRDAIVRARGELNSLPMTIMEQQEALADLVIDKTLAERTKESEFAITIAGSNFDERSEAGDAITNILPNISTGTDRSIGQYRGFALRISKEPDGFRFHLNNPATKFEHISNPIQEVTGLGAVQRIDNVVTAIKGKADKTENTLKQNRASLITFQGQAEKPFAEGDRLQRLKDDLVEIERRLQGQEQESKREADAGRFFISTQEGFKEVPDAEAVSFPGFRDFEFFVSRVGTEYAVREAASGKLISSGGSRQNAIDSSERRLETVGAERFRQLQQEGDRSPHRSRELVGV